VSLTLKEFICKLTFPLLYLFLFKFGQIHRFYSTVYTVHKTSLKYSILSVVRMHKIRMQNVRNSMLYTVGTFFVTYNFALLGF
jgi:hypothetical protein